MLALAGAVLAGCQTGVTGTSEVSDPEASNPHGCADLFAPGLLPTFEIQIAPAEWSAIGAEYRDWKARQEQNLDLKPYHPLISFRYGPEVVSDAQIKLQGTPSDHWVGDKMQFTVSFNQTNPAGRFHGLRKVVFHAQPNDLTLLRERLAYSFVRLLGLPGPCENNSRLVVNGSFYGVYANREDSDDAYLHRVFPGATGGDMWKGGYTLDNHATPINPAGHNALMNMTAADASTMEGLVDMDATLAEWAAEAMLPDSDGYWALAHNFYIYDHPSRGFMWLPYDMDATFDFVGFDVDPITWVPSWATGSGVHQQAVMATPDLAARYVAALQRTWQAYDVNLLSARLQRWSAQITDSVDADHVKPFTTDEYRVAVQQMNNFLPLRWRFVQSWLQCYQTGVGEDADHDGFIWCRDCNDHDPAINPDAAEICGNDVDENCNGRKNDCAQSP
jgi:CotH kinase protein/Putative metal-binding motif